MNHLLLWLSMWLFFEKWQVFWSIVSKHLPDFFKLWEIVQNRTRHFAVFRYKQNCDRRATFCGRCPLFCYAYVFNKLLDQESNVSKISFQINLSCAVMRFQSKLFRKVFCSSSVSSSCFFFFCEWISKKESLYLTASSV